LEAPSSSSIRQGSQEGAAAVQPEAEWKSRGDLKLNSDIQERASEFGARSSYIPLLHSSSTQTEDNVQNHAIFGASWLV